MFLYSKLAFGFELKKKLPTSFPKIDIRFFLALISIFGFYFFYFGILKYIIVF